MILSILILSNLSINVHASTSIISHSEKEIKTYSEEVSWYYRKINGKGQKRLWSRTYGYWLTDWIWI